MQLYKTILTNVRMAFFPIAYGLSGALVGGTLYSSANLFAMAVCAYIVWGCRQTWEHAKTLSWLKFALLAILMIWSSVVMFTQTFNPFIYFIF